MSTFNYAGSRRSHQRSMLVLALGALLPSGAVVAQKATGEIFGHAEANAFVAIENADTGLRREITADSSGRFSFSQLPTGRYKISTNSKTRDVSVKVGTGSEVDFVAAGRPAEQLDVVQVLGTAINAIDVSSVESSTVFSAEQMATLPVARDISAVALLAPGTVRGDTGFEGLGGGSLASFGGASVAENGYYINGFDVTNIRNFTAFANLPFDAIGEQQIKTGGYGAEFGRSLGGVINLVTKRGGNQFKGGASVYWEPNSLREQAPNVRDAERPETYYRYTKPDTSDSISYNAYASGPFVKDRLFFFVLAEGQDVDTGNYAAGDDARRNRFRSNDKPHGMIKLDWNVRR